jgi:hypothetical protein
MGWCSNSLWGGRSHRRRAAIDPGEDDECGMVTGSALPIRMVRRYLLQAVCMYVRQRLPTLNIADGAKDGKSLILSVAGEVCYSFLLLQRRVSSALPAITIKRL